MSTLPGLNGKLAHQPRGQCGLGIATSLAQQHLDVAFDGAPELGADADIMARAAVQT